jgi:hypothetical protein
MTADVDRLPAGLWSGAAPTEPSGAEPTGPGARPGRAELRRQRERSGGAAGAAGDAAVAAATRAESRRRQEQSRREARRDRALWRAWWIYPLLLLLALCVVLGVRSASTPVPAGPQWVVTSTTPAPTAVQPPTG